MAIYFLNAEFNYPETLVDKVSKAVSSYAEAATKDLNVLKPFDITIYPNHEWTHELDGVDGDALSAGVVQIRLDLRGQKFKIDEVLGTPLKAVMYHEINHIARWQGPGYGETLPEAVISEGIATVYERLVTEPHTMPHADYTDIEQILPYYTNRNKAEDATYNHRNWFFGSDSKYPKYLGYKIGTYIIDKVLKHNPLLSIKDLTRMEASEIMDLAKLHH